MTDDPRIRCLVLNAGGTKLAGKPAAERWAAATAAADARPDVAFIQEVPSDAWLAQWQAHGYQIHLGHSRGWTVRSAILTLLDDELCVPLTAADVPELRYHGEYVAVARLVGWASDGGPLTLFSVHASPRLATDEYLRHHPDAHRLAARHGGVGVRDAGKLFDSDVVLDTVSRYAPAVLACGDLNEARGWDDAPGHEGHTWGADYFGRPDAAGDLTGGALQAVKLIDVSFGEDGREVVTRRMPGHPPLQLDHLLAGPEVARRISDVRVHPAWATDEPLPVGLADHAPITFTYRHASPDRPSGSGAS